MSIPYNCRQIVDHFFKTSFLWHILPAAPALTTEVVITACLMYSWSYQTYYVRIHRDQRCFRWKKLKNCSCFLWQYLFSLWSPANVAIWTKKTKKPKPPIIILLILWWSFHSWMDLYPQISKHFQEKQNQYISVIIVLVRLETTAVFISQNLR